MQIAPGSQLYVPQYIANKQRIIANDISRQVAVHNPSAKIIIPKIIDWVPHPHDEWLNTDLDRPPHLTHTDDLPERLFEVEPHGLRPVFEKIPTIWANDISYMMSIAEIEYKTGYKLTRMQLEVLYSNAKFIVLSWARREGKDIIGTIKMLVHALYDPGHYLIGYPSAEHAKSAILRGVTAESEAFLPKIIPAHAVRRWYTMSDPVIHFRNGSTIAWRGVEYKHGAGNTGGNYKGVMMAEFATTKHGKEAYDDHIAPTMSLTDGFTIIQSTHNEDGDDFDMWRHEAQKHFRARTMTPSGRLLYHYIEATPRDRNNRMFEWGLESIHRGEKRSSLARHFYQKRGFPNLKHAVWEDLLKKVKLEKNLADYRYPVFWACDLGGRCNTAVVFYQELIDGLRFIDFFEMRRGDGNGEVGTPFVIKEIKQRIVPFNDIAIGYPPHDCDTLKSADQYNTPYYNMQREGLVVIKLRRPKNLLEDIFNVREFNIYHEDTYGHPIRFDEKAKGLLDHLMQYKWSSDPFGNPTDKIARSWHNDAADAFRYAVTTIIPDRTYRPWDQVKRFFPDYRCPQ